MSLGGAGPGPEKRCMAYLQRAVELEAFEPVVAHYCRLFAVELLMRARQNGQATAESNKLLLEQLELAEVSKKALDLSKGQEVMEAFALNVFDGADAADRSGQRDANLPGHFYAAAIFVEVCEQFHGGELPPDLVEKVRYAKYRAVHLRSCLQQGLEPNPPAGSVNGGQQAPEETSAAQGNAPRPTEAAALGPVAAPAVAPAGQAAPAPAPILGAPSAALAAAAPRPAATAGTPTLACPVAPAKAPAAAPAAATSGRSVVAEAKRKVQHAASALDFNDVATARNNLLEALQMLESS